MNIFRLSLSKQLTSRSQCHLLIRAWSSTGIAKNCLWVPLFIICRLFSELSYIVQLIWLQFEHAWHHHHLSHRESYSIERMQALDDNSRHVSGWHVWVVCLMLPMPALVITVLLECIPLQNPSNGWQANKGFWTRFFIAISIVVVGFLVQI